MSRNSPKNKNTKNATTRLATSLALIASAGITAGATGAEDSEETVMEEIVVTGVRTTIQNSIDLKRNATQVIDGLSSDDLGDIPALSIGDALETVTGATSHRENGGATEISIRGASFHRSYLTR